MDPPCGGTCPRRTARRREALLERDDRMLQRTLERALRRIKEDPRSAHWAEFAARCMRLLGDERATEYLRRAARINLVEAGDPPHAGRKLNKAANLLRLAGDGVGSLAGHLERFRVGLEPAAIERLVEERQSEGLTNLMHCCLLLGLDVEVEALGELYRSHEPTYLLGPFDAMVARARRSGDGALAARATEELGRSIRINGGALMHDQATSWGMDRCS